MVMIHAVITLNSLNSLYFDMNLLIKDIDNCIMALECHIIDHEEDAIKNNLGESEWNRIGELKSTLNNLQLLKAIYHG